MTNAEKEIRNRIRVSVAAYAYEIDNDPLMSDAEFDSLCLQIKPKQATNNKELDDFFKEVFDPNTGSWIHKHPNLVGVKRVVDFIRSLNKGESHE